jgi:ribonucleoside-diphosphate reductase alpha chain
MFSQITGAVEQGGSRRGSLMLCNWCWHPDTLELIDIKAQREEITLPDGTKFSRNKKLLNHANVSIMLTNNFMAAVENDDDWDFIFPNTKDPDYDTLWDGNIWTWRDKLGKDVLTYSTVKARDVWNRIIHRAWESGEPGLIFMERANDLSNSWYYSALIGTNPCGEEFLPHAGVCNLAHINLSKYVVPNRLPTTTMSDELARTQFDFKLFVQDIHIGIRFLDNVTDLNKYNDAAVEKQQMSERRVGLGILGYGDMLIRLGLRYGRDEALKFTDYLMAMFATTAYEESTLLAKERGAFPQFQTEPFLASGFMRTMPDITRNQITQRGMRNVTCTTCAPTGSVASLMNTSGGCEPFFDLEYTSTTRIGIVNERSGVVDTIFDQFGKDPTGWPDYVVTAQRGITPKDHVRTQATIQRWIDASISKTVNVPNNASVQDVSDAYKYMWEMGCKGGTVYRDGSRDEQVLYTNKKEDKVPVQIVEATTNNDVVRPRPDVGVGPTFSEDSPVGTVHLTLRHDPTTGEPIDIFVTTGKGDSSADGEAFGRLMSMILRFPDNAKINQQTRIQLIRDQLIDILGRGQVGFGPDAKRSLPDTIAKILNRYLEGDFPGANLPYGLQPMKELLDEMAGAGGDAEKIGYIRKYILEGDPGNGHEDDTYREEMEAEIQKAENGGMKLPYDYCPGCGNCTLVIVPGKCPFCRNCGFTQC